MGGNRGREEGEIENESEREKGSETAKASVPMTKNADFGGEKGKERERGRERRESEGRERRERRGELVAPAEGPRLHHPWTRQRRLKRGSAGHGGARLGSLGRQAAAGRPLQRRPWHNLAAPAPLGAPRQARVMPGIGIEGEIEIAPRRIGSWRSLPPLRDSEGIRRESPLWCFIRRRTAAGGGVAGGRAGEIERARE